MAVAAAFELRDEGEASVLALSGDWTIDTIAELDARLRELSPQVKAGTMVDVAGLGRIDVAGAYVIDRTLRANAETGALPVRGEHAPAKRLLEAARRASETPPAPAPPHPIWELFLARIGAAVVDIGESVLVILAFLGETLTVLGRLIVNPRRIRWVSIAHVMEYSGLNALPIVSLLSFFIGVVVAYLGARILADYGASVFTVELVAISVMREFGIVITAVLLAGRTDSSFTAEIGAMKMRQEIDAMRIIGVDPMEALVAPRVIAMLVMTPLLTFAAVIAGLFGGFLVVWFDLGVSPAMFISRISENVPAQHFWVGMSKAPVFAFVLAVVGCRHGLSVGGDVASLGRRVTSSVVEAIFLVVLIDALFAIWYLELDL
ncbi:MAG TPA: ABC transporter permease [Caulobacterales bacterium]|nr:ABC transporter permease [Caulobacterales bacterium]